MRFKKLGRTGLKVSEICLGTMTYGDQVGETEAIRIMKKGLDAGVNFLDTADAYVEGRSEEIVGKSHRGDTARPGRLGSPRQGALHSLF
jgi:aryl-alcohol dehydrogenase-like predicted oxidoreductase